MTDAKLFKKILLLLIEIIIMFVLFVIAYKTYKTSNKILSFNEAKDEYSYIDISNMSEKFAYDEAKDVGIHFVIEKEQTGKWHVYLIAIKEKEYEKYKRIIDYSYERIKEKPEPVRVYGYPSLTNENLKDLAIKNISNFLPRENKIEINNANYETYLTNSYLDTTLTKKQIINIYLIGTIIMFIVIIITIITTIIEKPVIKKGVKYAVRKTRKRRV